MNELRDKLLQIAYAELGNSDPHRYWLEAFGSDPNTPKRKLSWCGIFCLYCMRKLELCDWMWITGKGFLFRLHITTKPQPGDIAYFNAPFQHHALVQSVEGNTLKLIQGNYGTPGHVGESTCSIAEKRPVFYSIEPLIQARLERANSGADCNEPFNPSQFRLPAEPE